MGNCCVKQGDNPPLREKLQEEDYRPSGSQVKVDDVSVTVDSQNRGNTAKSVSQGGGKRRVAVRGEQVEEDPGEFLKSMKSVPKSDDSRRAIEASMKEHFLFAGMKTEYLHRAVDVMFPVDVQSGDVVIKQGDKGDNFYVVESGSFEVLVDGNQVLTYDNKGSFGDLALMYNAPRAATVRALTEAKLWAIDRIAFRRLMVAATSEDANEKRQFLRRVDLLKDLSEAEMTQLVEAMEVEDFNDGQEIIRQGEPGAKFYIIWEGDVKVTQGEKELLRLKRGGHFGERALLTNEPRAASVTAIGNATCLSLSADMFQSMLGSLNDVLDRSLFKMVLQSVPLLKDMDEEGISQIMNALQRHEFHNGDKIISQGDVGDRFYIIIEGSVVCRKTEDPADSGLTLSKGEFFGERALQFEEPRAANVLATADCKLVSLGRNEFQKVQGRMKELQALKEQELARNKKVDIKFNELKKVAILGKGTFGTVWLVHHKSSGDSFAMKVMQKMRVINFKQVEHVKKEKELLMATHHPFLLNLITTFQDERNIFLICELVQGGELFTRLQQCGKFDERTAKFYAGCVVLAFEYLHNRHIIYRDLKPENMLIDRDGYAKVVDFGFAKYVPNRTFTLCGTPDYLAPEIIASKGHNKAVDWWAVGVLIYEMLGGYPPFFANDPMQTYQKIMANKAKQPSFKAHKHVSKEAMDLIYKLLHPNPAQRYGCLKGGATDVKTHPWFKGFDWDGLFKKQLKAPYVPTIRDALDTSNFDDYSEDEEAEVYYGHDFDDF
eukprot:Rmarinus@m.19539